VGRETRFRPVLYIPRLIVISIFLTMGHYNLQNCFFGICPSSKLYAKITFRKLGSSSVFRLKMEGEWTGNLCGGQFWLWLNQVAQHIGFLSFISLSYLKMEAVSSLRNVVIS